MNLVLKVLVVEDSGFFRRALAANLTRNGFDVVTALNGQEAIQQAQKELPHVIVLDMAMPKLDGMMVLRLLKTMPECTGIPVILLSGTVPDKDLPIALRLGVVACVSKMSMEFKSLVTLISDHGVPYMDSLLKEEEKKHSAIGCPVPLTMQIENTAQGLA